MITLKIALTGGVACGKSQFADFFSTLGADVIRLDDISKQVTISGSDGLKELTNHFGKKILHYDGSLNTKVLRSILLKNKANQMLIEDILHPRILSKMQELQKQSKKALIVVEIPLLCEKKLEYLFDRVIVITCDEEKQLARLKNRENIDENLAKQMIAAQMSQQDRLKAVKQMPSDIIENNKNIENLEQQALQLYNRLLIKQIKR